MTETDLLASDETETISESSGPWPHLLALLGLTGFAIAQPLLAVAGEDPTLFIVAGVEGWAIAAFGLIVAFLPALVLWAVVEAVGRVDRVAGEVAFVIIAAALAGTTAIQWVKTSGGIDARWALAIAGAFGAAAFGVALVRVRAVGLWTRYTAVLPPVAVLLLVVASPTGELMRSRSTPELEASSGGAKAPVVFVMLDELPTRTLLAEDGTIDAVRFPNLAELASGATWYRDYTAMANLTLQSVPGILSGTVPDGGGAPIWTQHPDNLFSLLAPTHELEVIEPVTQLCGFTTCGIEGVPAGGRGGMRSVLARMAEVWSDRVALAPIPEADVEEFASLVGLSEGDGHPSGSSEAGQTGSDQVGDFVDALGPRPPGELPVFGYMHLVLPHQPWVRYPDGRSFLGASTLDTVLDGIDGTAWDVALLEQAHTFQATYTDRLVGRVLDGLREAGTYDDTLVVVTADHGIRFAIDRFPDLRNADIETVDELAYVPLLVKAPGQSEGRIDDRNLMGVDVLPTIAAELDIDVPWEVVGLPASSPEVAARGDRKTFFNLGGLFGNTSRDEITFRSSDHRPSAADRLIGSGHPGEHSLAALVRDLGGDRWIGVPVADLDVRPGDPAATVTMSDLERLRDGDADQQLGRLRATSSGLDADDTVLLVLDGIVQSASPVLPSGRLAFFVPPEVVAHEDLRASLLVVEGDRYLDVALTA